MSIISFFKGSRYYTIKFEINGTEIYYGASIYRDEDGNHPRLSYEEAYSHLETAMTRFERFPVTASWKGYPDGIKTRGQMESYHNVNKFKKEMVTIMCQNGVRYRPSGTPPETTSIREQQFIHSMNKKNKEHNRALAKYENNKIRDEEQETYETRLRLYNSSVERLDEDLPYHKVIIRDHHSERIFHIVYKRASDGQIEYGACVFNPTSSQDWIRYDEDQHFGTAWERFKRFPVKGINLNFETHSYGTRQATSGKIPIYNVKGINGLRKCIAKYGVRSRENGIMYLKSDEKWGKCMSQTKNLRRQFQMKREEYEAWIARSVSNKSLVFV
jgi:hypothetical protein